MVVVERQLRELMARGWTQGEIGDWVGLTQPSISRLMRGEHRDTYSATAARIKELHDAVVSEALPKPRRPTTAKPKPRKKAA